MSLKKNVLIVDDEAELISILIDDLQDLGSINFHAARDGTVAYRKARTQEFDLIFTDFRMPRLSGADLISALREQEFNNEAPVIIISGYEEEARTACERNRLTKNIEIMSKPYDVNTVRTLAKKYLERSKGPPVAEPAPAKAEPAAKPKIDVDFLNAFWTAVVQAVGVMGKVQDIKAAKTHALKAGDSLKADISGTIEIQAPAFAGTLFVSFPETTFLPFVSRMLGQEYRQINSDIEEAAAELTNIIYGNARKNLEEKNYQMQRAFPSTIHGTGHPIHGLNGAPLLVTDFTSEIGPFFVALSIKLKEQKRVA